MLRRAKIVHYLHGKTSEGYFAGLAIRSSGISIGFAGQTLAAGMDASDKVVTIIAHEVGHNRGAWHVETPTIMNTAALAFPVQPRTWDPVSLAQMR